MKKFYLLIILLFSISITSIRVNAKIILQPDYEMSDITLSIDKIELTDSSTILDMSFYSLPQNAIRLIPETYLLGKNTGKEYKIKSTDGFQLGEWINIPETGFIESKFFFEPLDESDLTVDFIEPDGWKVLGVKLYDDSVGKIKTNISGDVKVPSTAWLVIEEEGNDMRIDKSYIVPVKNGKFSYELYTDYPRQFTIARGIEILRGSWRIGRFWSEGDDVNINFTLAERNKAMIEVDGGKLTDETDSFLNSLQNLTDEFYNNNPAYIKYHQMEDEGTLYTEEANALREKKELTSTPQEEIEINNQIKSLNEENKIFTPEGLKARDEYYDFLDTSRDSLKNLELQFYKKELNPPSLNGLAQIFTNLKYKSELSDSLILLFEENYSNFMPDHPYHKFITEMTRVLNPIPGNKYIDLRAPTPNGIFFNISDVIKGKIAVIDLWASWCGPCRAHSMALIPVYEKYKDKGFRIIGIARESGDTKAMENAIEKDGYPWVNLVDLNDKLGVWSKYRAGLSGGKQILVDENGIIVAVDPTAEEVESYLESRLQ